MVLTGVEIVGVVLAVLPLFITVLENHKAETKPFIALLMYDKELMKAVQEFGIIKSKYNRVVELIIEDLSLSPSQKSSLHRSLREFGDASAWMKEDVEQALADHLGEMHYREGVLPLFEKIWKGVLDISGILGLGVERESTNARVRFTVVWEGGNC